MKTDRAISTPWRARRLAALLACALAAAAPPASGYIITVDVNGGGDFTTILPAIEIAREGDTIVVWPGTYSGEGNHDLDFEGKSLQLISTDGAEETIIDLGGHGGIILEDSQTMTTEIQGFTFTNSGVTSVTLYLIVEAYYSSGGAIALTISNS